MRHKRVYRLSHLRGRRRGYFLLEITMGLGMLVLFALLAGQLFGSVFKIFGASGKENERAMRFDAAVMQLRDDINAAASTETPSAGMLIIHTRDNQMIQWQTDDAKTNVTRVAGEARRTFDIGSSVAFQKDGAITLLHPNDAADSTADLAFAPGEEAMR